MKKFYTSEDVRKQESIFKKAFWWFIGLAVLSTVFILLLNLQDRLAIVLVGVSLVLTAIQLLIFIYHNTKLALINKRVSKKEGTKFQKELELKKLSFCKLSDGSLEMHHELYTKEEMKKMISEGISTEQIISLWKEQLMKDFKRLESFIKNSSTKGEVIEIHTYTHQRMYKVWNKIARDAGLELEVMKGNNQKPVGYKWRAWKKDVYLTSGKKAKKDSIPKANEWNKYVLTSKGQ